MPAIDILFPVLHGLNGEDGSIQGQAASGIAYPDLIDRVIRHGWSGPRRQEIVPEPDASLNSPLALCRRASYIGWAGLAGA